MPAYHTPNRRGRSYHRHEFHGEQWYVCGRVKGFWNRLNCRLRLVYRPIFEDVCRTRVLHHAQKWCEGAKEPYPGGGPLKMEPMPED